MAAFEEGVGESSSPPQSQGLGLLDALGVKDKIYNKLVEVGNVEAVSNPDFRSQLDAHLNRFPPSYALDVNDDRAENVVVHQKLLALAKDPRKRPSFNVRLLKLEELNRDAGKDDEEIDERRIEVETSSVRHDTSFASVHEITFSTVDKPKLLSQLSALLSDVGLNIREAHVFSTKDGYSLDVFVVDGWSIEDTDGLRKALQLAIEKSEKSLSGSSNSALGRDLAVQANLGDWAINMDLVKMGEKIGSGSCGDLYRSLYLGQEVAVKVLKFEHLTDAVEGEFAQEVNILRHVQHGNVVRFIGVCTKPQLCLVTEYMGGGSLYDFLHKHQNSLELPLLLKLAIDICKGMDYLHQKNIIHRDLKTANLLMDSNGVVKVADFGVARFQSRAGVMTAETGTYRWMAPEVINHRHYNEKADVFSFAIVLWELATSKIPYDTMTPVQAAIGVRQGLRPALPENTHPRLVGLLQRCWEAVPSKRPSFSKIISELEEFLQQVQQDKEKYQSINRRSPKQLKKHR